MSSIISMSTIGILVGFVVPAIGQAAPIGGAMLGNTCAGCHGTFGAAESTKIPPLAGAVEAQFIATMLAYRDGSRVGTIMNRVARAYSDDEIAAMAAYFAALPSDISE